MPSPFPGMDPCLESPHLWPDVHHGLIGQIQSRLNSSLRPRYVARVEMRVYISDDDDPGREVIVPDVRIEKPKRRSAGKKSIEPALAIVEPMIIPFLFDDEIEEARLEIREVNSGSLVTIIEILSPTNKIRGSRGRASFMEKRRDTMASEVHWVEIDLLRAGLPSVLNPPVAPCDYRVLVSQGHQRAKGRYWPISIRQPLPIIGIPLRGKDHDVPIELGEVLRSAYEVGAYDMSIDYRKEPQPPLSADNKKWMHHLLREKGLR